MAKRKINKSQLIRDYQKQNPKAGPTEVAKALTAKHGVKFTPTAVSNTKAAGKGKKKGSKVRTAGFEIGNGHPPKGDIFDAMKLIRQAVEIIGADMAKRAADLFGGK